MNLASGREFDNDAPVEGLRIVNDREFEVELNAPPPARILHVLAKQPFSVVPREAVETYGERFGLHPVGTGPFTLDEDDWRRGEQLTVNKNPNYHLCRYPEAGAEEDKAAGLAEATGTRLPILDRVEIRFYVESEPLWRDFREGRLDFATVPAEFFEEAVDPRTRHLKPEFRRDGISLHPVPLLDFIFIGFNMEDPLVGGYEPKQVALRKAICAALDWEARNAEFYNGNCVAYDGPIPPGLDGYPPMGAIPDGYRGPDLERARKWLEEAGYPMGEGLPAIDFYTSRGGESAAQAEMLSRQLAKINVKLEPHLVDFPTLIDVVNKRRAPFFSFAWGSDYPDAENNLSLFYSPNAAPGANHFNYKREEYDRLYERIFHMEPAPERTELYEKMRDMVYEDAPFAGSMARTRFFLSHQRLKNFKPAEVFRNWYKYLDVDDSSD